MYNDIPIEKINWGESKMNFSKYIYSTRIK